MHIRSAEFVVSAVDQGDLPADGLPEVALAGRSNVGKSSLINRLAQRRSLARTSSTPGKTQQLNYYRIDSALYLVDLPGYGFVKGGVELRLKLGRLVQGYLERRAELRAIIQLIDARHGPTDLDLAMIDWLKEHPKPFLMVFTKLDKLSRQQWRTRLDQLGASGVLAGLAYLPFSAVTGEGREEALEWIYQESGVSL
ncbi:MAG: YihA family ribosome biogenesis GTP-binding protein [Candidatus Latescibacteria bacterium]|nr:YihA family ribosome biogenesis GTP-binding protein [Candidatus Latescibacterota bacterium]